MRLSDTARMALLNLWSRKRRTLLNLAGIVTGCTMLMMTFAGTRGVAEGIHAIIDQSEGVRRFAIYAGWEAENEPPEEVLEVEGEMSEERRERIRQVLRDQWLWEHGTYTQFEPEQYEAVAKWDHVSEVIAGGSLFCRYELVEGPLDAPRLADDAFEGGCDTASMVDVALGNRVVTGERLNADDEDGVLISEIGAYFLGYSDDSEIKELVGRKVRIEFSSFNQRTSVLTRLMNSGFEQGEIFEQADLLLALKQLMESLDETGLSEEQIELIRDAFLPDSADQSAQDARMHEAEDRAPDEESVESLGKIHIQEFTIRGVVSSGGEDGVLSFLNQVTRDDGPEFLLHPTAVSKIRAMFPDEFGNIGHAHGLVDRVGNLGAVEERLREEGFDYYSASWIIEQIDVQIRNARIAISLIAGLILLITSISLTNTMIIAVMERTPEFGIMKALGARNGHLLKLMLFEGAITGLLGAAISVAISYGLAGFIAGFVRKYVENRMGNPFDATIFLFSTVDTLLVFAVAFLVCTLAGILPAFRAARLDPVVAMQRK